MAQDASRRLSGLKIFTPETELIEEDHVEFREDTPPDSDRKAKLPEFGRSSFGRSDSNDSLDNLIGRSPSLSHIEELFALPSPVTMSVATMSPHTMRVRAFASDAASSPLRQTTSRKKPAMLSIESLHETKEPQSRLLPANSVARLQQEARSARHVSLDVSQPVGSIEMPQLARHRSQSKVPKYGETESLHRESLYANVNGSDMDHNLRKHLICSEDELQETFVINYNGVQGTYHGLRTLGEGAFSRVILALQERNGTYHPKCPGIVAIKVVQLLPYGSDEQARVAMAVRREIDLLGRLSLPLLIKLYAFSVDKERAHLVLDYHPGGDLFVLASEHKFSLIPRLVKRVFAEVLTAVRYLHKLNIVHRDLKLENILLRLPLSEITSSSPYTQLLTCLTDLGLAREFDPESPELATRCGSEDYAAPEIIMGQPYDGRQTDAWALGALLYCLLEGRLPFDVIPGLEHKMKSKVLHRICRIEWRWVLFKEAGSYNPEWDGAKRIVANLLRSRTKRWTLEEIAQDDWLAEEVGLVEGLVAKESQSQE